MNDHLIKKHRKSTVLRFLLILVVFGLFIYTSENNKWFTSIFMSIIIGYSMFKSKKILLEAVKNEGIYTLRSYSIINGKKEIKISSDRLIDLELSGSTLVFWHKDNYGKTTEKYELNTEPWNELYSQIRSLKTDIQEHNKK